MVLFETLISPLEYDSRESPPKEEDCYELVDGLFVIVFPVKVRFAVPLT